ncbi:hypothetical protein BgiBS90_028494 [Biomphalaria glabrata]|nr:hypothetical protein BgiBS90_028494 [Biomphalaria glabrata]
MTLHSGDELFTIGNYVTDVALWLLGIRGYPCERPTPAMGLQHKGAPLDRESGTKNTCTARPVIFAYLLKVASNTIDEHSSVSPLV